MYCTQQMIQEENFRKELQKFSPLKVLPYTVGILITIMASLHSIVVKILLLNMISNYFVTIINWPDYRC